MDNTVQDTIRAAISGSLAGQLHFGQVVQMLLQAGVESYLIDYRTLRATYYLPDGSTLCETLPGPAAAIAAQFDAAGVQAAIRAAQAGQLLYPQFKQRTAAAGCAAYWVWLHGRKVDYFGRHGEIHCERFPD